MAKVMARSMTRQTAWTLIIVLPGWRQMIIVYSERCGWISFSVCVLVYAQELHYEAYCNCNDIFPCDCFGDPRSNLPWWNEHESNYHSDSDCRDTHAWEIGWKSIGWWWRIITTTSREFSIISAHPSLFDGSNPSTPSSLRRSISIFIRSNPSTLS